MKVLFVSRGNKCLSPIVAAQAESLRSASLEVDVFKINGRGIIGYLCYVPKLRKHARESMPDVIHAHYSLSGITAWLSGVKPLVTSLMGSDVKGLKIFRLVIRFFASNLWNATIVKSQDMKTSLGFEFAKVIPNGVDLDRFKPMDKQACRVKLGWTGLMEIILFAADPKRSEKNFLLAEEAISELNCQGITLKVVYGADHDVMPTYLNAADLLVLTSKWEGSPNVVKEAMACNLPVVSTDVGDVAELFGESRMYRVSKAEPKLLASAIRDVLDSSEMPRGRERIEELGLDSASVADKLVSIYENVTNTSIRRGRK